MKTINTIIFVLALALAVGGMIGSLFATEKTIHRGDAYPSDAFIPNVGCALYGETEEGWEWCREVWADRGHHRHENVILVFGDWDYHPEIYEMTW